MVSFGHTFGYQLQSFAAVAKHRDIGLDIFAELGLVNVQMYYFGLTGIGGEGSGDTVTEPHSNGYEQVAFVGFDVGGQIAVHSEHAHIKRVIGGQGGKPQKGACCGQTALFDELPKLLFGLTQLHSVSYEDKRLAGFVYEAYGSLNLPHVGVGRGYVAAYILYMFGLEIYHAHLCGFGKVQHHRTGAS